jgi:mono/diheme cytochrome c family protein
MVTKLSNEIATTDISLQRTAWILLAVLAVVLAAVVAFHQVQGNDPYTQNVLARQGDVAQGQVIFQLNCAGCHGADADGRVGPSLHHVASRKSRTGLIKQVTSGETPPMPQFQPTVQEMADLLTYLESL